MGKSCSLTGSSSSTCAHNLNMPGLNKTGPMLVEIALVDLPFGALEGSGGLPAALAASSLRRLRSCTPACHRRFWCLIHAAGSSCLQCSQINALLQSPSLNKNVAPACWVRCRCRLLLARHAHDHQLPVLQALLQQYELNVLFQARLHAHSKETLAQLIDKAASAGRRVREGARGRGVKGIRRTAAVGQKLLTCQGMPPLVLDWMARLGYSSHLLHSLLIPLPV